MRHIVPIICVFALIACEKEVRKEGEPSATEKEAPAAPAAFEWTEAPAADKIPGGPVKMDANGEKLDAKAVYFEPGFKEWRMVIHSGALKKPTSIRPRGQFVSISLAEEPRAGKTIVKKMKYGNGYYQVKKTDDPEKTTSWNASNAYVIQITKWDVKPYDPKGRIFQSAGTASGKVAIVYKGSGSFKNSFAAGTFKDVPVRYMGKPFWVRQKEKKEKQARR
jgi:hypothetical protein